MNNLALLRQLLSFMSIKDPNGDWDELDAVDATKQDLIYLLAVLTEWISEGLEITPIVKEDIEYLNQIITN